MQTLLMQQKNKVTVKIAEGFIFLRNDCVCLGIVIRKKTVNVFLVKCFHWLHFSTFNSQASA